EPGDETLIARSLICAALNPTLSAPLHRMLDKRLSDRLLESTSDLLALWTRMHAFYCRNADISLTSDAIIEPYRYRLEIELGPEAAVLPSLPIGVPHLSVAERSHTTQDVAAHTVLECSPVGVIRLDLNGRIVYENPATRELFGVPTNEPSPAMGTVLADLPNVKALDIDEDLSRLLVNREPFERRRLPFTSLFGRELTITLEGRPIMSAQGHDAGTVFVLTDISRETALESQLVRAQKLEIFGTLVGHVADDLNNILVGVRGHSSLLRQQLGADSRYGSTAEHLDEAASRMAAVVDGLLALARPSDETGVHSTECAALLRQTVEILGGLLPNKIQLVVHADAPVWCRIGAAHLRQVIVNICVNARDAIISSPTVFSSGSGRINIELTSGKSDATIAITDNGAGMDPIVRAQVFDPLFTTKVAGEGSGLGMPVSLGLVRSYGGTIDCDSHPGRGTTFSVQLPLAPPPEHAPQVRAKRDRGRVLVVEDHDVVRQLCVQVLQGDGLDVSVARNGQEAIELAKLHVFALALVDVGLPDIDGRVVAERLSPTPILLTSGNPPQVVSSSAPTADGAAQQPWRFLKKPYLVPELLAAVDDMLQGC
ncbi:MAG: two-component system cell cycle sensor histidine kinase/response regulator CckA, partial [Myxococcota bacterium]